MLKFNLSFKKKILLLKEVKSCHVVVVVTVTKTSFHFCLALEIPGAS